MVDLERLRDNLKYIRRGRGLTLAKLAECQYVMEVLGDLPLRVAYERLAGMVRMLGEDVQAMALRNADAIDMRAPDTLTRRRERIAGIHGLSSRDAAARRGLLLAMNATHNLDAMAACFADDYVNEWPAHLQRGTSRQRPGAPH